MASHSRLPVNSRLASGSLWRLPKPPHRQGWVSEELSWQSREEDQGGSEASGSNRSLGWGVYGASVRC